jgi:haloacid dehalogenase-like hydrolase
MGRKRIGMAIAYDFDGTLSPGNMQEYDFIPALGLRPKEFWKEVKQNAQKDDADEILAYMSLMLEKAHHKKVSVRRQNFVDFGRGVELFTGVADWFDRINRYANDEKVCVQHFIISSGIREMVEGTAVAKHFAAIFASAFKYDHNDVAHWPALALNYTTKTQYLFRINKGNLNVWDNSRINEFVEKSKRSVPFERMIFIGDGQTDVPCMRLVKDQGGHSIAVYCKRKRFALKRAQDLLTQGRVNFVAPADYTDGSPLDQIVKAIVSKVAADGALFALGKAA